MTQVQIVLGSASDLDAVQGVGKVGLKPAALAAAQILALANPNVMTKLRAQLARTAKAPPFDVKSAPE